MSPTTEERATRRVPWRRGQGPSQAGCWHRGDRRRVDGLVEALLLESAGDRRQAAARLETWGCRRSRSATCRRRAAAMAPDVVRLVAPSPRRPAACPSVVEELSTAPRSPRPRPLAGSRCVAADCSTTTSGCCSRPSRTPSRAPPLSAGGGLRGRRDHPRTDWRSSDAGSLLDEATAIYRATRRRSRRQPRLVGAAWSWGQGRRAPPRPRFGWPR